VIVAASTTFQNKPLISSAAFFLHRRADSLGRRAVKVIPRFEALEFADAR
jgi:hypothetical protein